MSLDVLVKLQEASWRGIGFPATSFKRSFEQDHADHKWPDRDGAHIEATGRAPYVFSFQIPFYNGIVPGKNEKWAPSGILYPTNYRLFEAACADRTTGDLVHPELGTIRCKVKSFESTVTAGTRSGAEVSVSWKESTDTAGELKELLAESSPIAEIELAALDLDGNIANVKGVKVPDLPQYKPDFAATMRSLKGIVDQASIFDQRVAGVVNSLIYRVDSLSSSIGGTKTDVRNWPVLQSIERMKSSLYDFSRLLASTVSTVGSTSGSNTFRPYSTFVVPADMGFSVLASAVSQFAGRKIQVGDLLIANPKLAGSPTVKGGTVVRYV